MGGSPNYNYPAQPTYGEGMADAMRAQMEMLTGQTLAKDEGFEELYASALGKEGGTLADIMREFEAPLRKETAQIDTDVMRQTLLGGERQAAQVEKNPKTGKYGYWKEGAEGKRTFVETAGQEGFGPNQATSGFSQEKLDEWSAAYEEVGAGDAQLNAWIKEYNALDNQFLGQELLPKINAAKAARSEKLREYTAKAETWQKEYDAAQEAPTADQAARREAESEYAAGLPSHVDPATGEATDLSVIREGKGMIDLMGDTRGVQEQTRSEDYAKYVQDNPDLSQQFGDARRGGDQRTIEEFGQDHYEFAGKAEGRDLPMGEYSLQDAGRQAGFSELGEFRGLSALAEDIGRGGQQRAREADIADVERLGGRATEAYRAQGDLSGALAQARGLGAGGAQGLSAIPEDPLFTGTATGTLAERTAAENLLIDKIGSGGMTYAKADPAADLTAEISYDPSVGVSGGTYSGELGAYDPTASSTLGGPARYPKPTLRSNLLADAKTSLAGGLTRREERQISEAMKAQSTMMGRTFDQSAGLAEAEARLLEDRNRQALNRQYAQQVLGQEAGLQQSDLGRGLQASLANQQAANQAAQYGVGAGLQREQVGAQLDQQTALANQAAKQEAARYTAQEAMQAKQMELGRQTAGVERQLTAEEKDIERAMRRGAMEEQYRQQGLGAERASAVQMVGLEQATSADPFQAILQRQGQNNLGAGNQLFGTAQYGLDSGPQYLNPEAGLGFIQNQATNAANMFNAQQMAGATRSAGMIGGLGTLGAGIAGMFDFCWVAREVYGSHNPAWLDFRQWMFSSAPRWFFKLYLAFGERFANFISDKPRLKARIRLWMDTKIGR